LILLVQRLQGGVSFQSITRKRRFIYAYDAFPLLIHPRCKPRVEKEGPKIGNHLRTKRVFLRHNDIPQLSSLLRPLIGRVNGTCLIGCIMSVYRDERQHISLASDRGDLLAGPGITRSIRCHLRTEGDLRSITKVRSRAEDFLGRRVSRVLASLSKVFLYMILGRIPCHMHMGNTRGFEDGKMGMYYQVPLPMRLSMTA
jgi:hypothetical protein